MFNDEVPFAFKKMHEFSTVDGFMEITESLGEMIKYIANEPSVGLFYIQQHTQNAVPNVINLRNNTVHKSRKMMLHTEDLEDSVTMVRSMKECGSPIAEEMIKDIKKSLYVMSTKQPKRGLLNNNQLERSSSSSSSSSWSPAAWGRNNNTLVYTQEPQLEEEGTGSYLSTVFKSAKQRANNFKWSQMDTKESESESEIPPSFVVGTATTPLVVADPEVEELPVSSQIEDDEAAAAAARVVDDGSLSTENLVLISEDFDEFKADREAKLQQWLAESVDDDGS